jgi:hypothetical protein
MQLAGDGRKSIGGIVRLMRPVNLLILFAVAISVAWPAPAHARKVALILANSAYGSIDDPVETRLGSLRNPPKDAELVKEAAEEAGFEVEIAPDLDRLGMIRALDTFAERADGAEIAMIYYAGHGIEIRDDGFGAGGQFAIPVDGKLGSELLVGETAVNILVMARALKGARNSILVLDACRDALANPNAPTYRSANTGLQRMPQAPGVFVMLSAGPNQRAEEGVAGEGSPFAQAFAHWFKTPGLSLSDFSSKVGQTLDDQTNGAQVPYSTSGGGVGALVFYPDPTPPPPVAPLVVPQMEGPDFAAAVQANTVEAYKAYVSKWPNSSNATFARGKIVELAEQEAPAESPPAAPSPPVERVVIRPPMEQGTIDTGRGNGPSEPQQNVVMTGNPSGTGGLQIGQTGVERERVEAGPAPARPFTPPSGPAQNRTSGTGDLASRQPPGGEPEGPATGPTNQRPAVPQEQPLVRQQPRPERVNNTPGCEVATTASEVNAALLRGVTPCGMAESDSAALVDKKPLPSLPSPPKFSDVGYPACRNEFEALTSDYDKLNSIVACQKKINTYYDKEMGAFSISINRYLDGLTDFYDAWVQNPATKQDYTPDTQRNFALVVIKGIHEKCQPGGEYMKDYEAAAQRRLDDLAFLTQQYNTIKARYPV